MKPYVNESHKEFCALRFMTAAQAAILRGKRYGDDRRYVPKGDLRCRCKTNPHLMRVNAYLAVIADQRARGIDPWSEEGWAERAKGSKRKVAKANPDGMVRHLELALAALVSAHQDVRSILEVA